MALSVQALKIKANNAAKIIKAKIGSKNDRFSSTFIACTLAGATCGACPCKVFTPKPTSNAVAHSGKARLMESALTCSKWEIASGSEEPASVAKNANAGVIERLKVLSISSTDAAPRTCSKNCCLRLTFDAKASLRRGFNCC
ncbi:hypothetical protein D3C71_1656830 [compost metagenome]